MKKPEIADVAAALREALVAALAASFVISTLFYVYPNRHLFRGVTAVTVILAVFGVFVLLPLLIRPGPESSGVEAGGSLAQALLAALVAAVLAALVAFVVILALPRFGLAPSTVAVFTVTLTFCGVFVSRLVSPLK